MIVVSSHHGARDRFNFISSKLPLYDTFVFICPRIAALGGLSVPSAVHICVYVNVHRATTAKQLYGQTDYKPTTQASVIICYRALYIISVL